MENGCAAGTGAFPAARKRKKLEEALATDLSLVGEGLLLKRQVATASGKFVDMLAVDVQGTLIVIELKRGKTPREAVAQLEKPECRETRIPHGNCAINSHSIS
ncbi:MAG TPA: endonuclease NucS domain-containing protein [Chthoniobacteraceae bacterium]|nr:endonuclease NucS domain-containing protein [Chthoniobacteraceae bacterium]